MSGVRRKKVEKAEGEQKPALRLEWIEAGSLAENPHNWRRHPEAQVSALKDLIGDDEIGWAGACLYNERTKRLIDGHARRNAVNASTPIPVLVGNWSEAAEKKILLTLDPLAGLAVPDVEQLEQLLGAVTLDTDALKSLGEDLAKLLETAATDEESDSPANGEPDEKKMYQDQFDVLVQCAGEVEQGEVLERLRGQGLSCRPVFTSFKVDRDQA